MDGNHSLSNHGVGQVTSVMHGGNNNIGGQVSVMHNMTNAIGGQPTSVMHSMTNAVGGQPTSVMHNMTNAVGGQPTSVMHMTNSVVGQASSVMHNMTNAVVGQTSSVMQNMSNPVGGQASPVLHNMSNAVVGQAPSVMQNMSNAVGGHTSSTLHNMSNAVGGQVTSVMHGVSNPVGGHISQSEESHHVPDKSTVLAVLQLLRKYNLKSTEDSLLREANINLDIGNQGSESEVNTVLSAYKSEGNPEFYEEAYTDLKKFVEGALDTYKHELGMVLYPVFVHMYLELVYNGHEAQATKFMQKFSRDQEVYYQNDLRRLAQVTKKDQMRGNELTETFKSNEFIIRMSRDTLTLLKRHLQEKKHSVLLNIIQEHLYFDMYEGVARNKQQIDATAGAVVGEATRQDNKAKIFYGMLKEPDIQYVPADEEEDGGEGEGGDKPKKKKAKKDPLLYKKAKSDPNAPPCDRLPLPELKDADKMEKVKAMREAIKRVTLGPENLPSICCYTLLNSASTVTCAEISEDSSAVAVGFADSSIRVWSLMPQKLRAMKSAEVLQEIDIEAEDVLARIMDDRSGEMSRCLSGHNGPVYKVSFSPDRMLLLSCSEDASIRLWSLMTWTCLVAFKGHTFPVWDVRFSPHGHYFATASHDRTARLWATDHHQPLRIFAGHFSDVDCIQFHPNSNYVATGSSDRTVRLWDCVTGNHVRLMTGHKNPIYALCFSIEGRFLVSAGGDFRVLLWDLAHGHLLAELTGHTAPIHSLAFSRDGHILTSGSLDSTIKVWDFTKLTEEVTLEDVNISHNPEVKKNSDSYLLRSYSTKNSPVLCFHFSRRNVLLCVSMYDSS